MSKIKLSNWQSEFSQEAIDLSQLEVGLKLISTIDERGLPHITLITFNKAKTPTEVVWGQFTEGQSKKNILKNPKQGLFYMNAAMPFKFVQAKVDFDHLQKGGEDCEYFSRLPLLRYMTYTNVHTIYHNNVVAVTPVRGLGLLGILKGAISQMIGKSGAKSDSPEDKIPDLGMNIFNQLTAAKFISFIDPSDGYPVILPCFQLRAPDKSRLIFPLSQFKDDLMAIPENTFVSTFGIISDNMELINQVIKGKFTGFQKARGITFGIIEVEEVYNSMPPLSGNIYPKLDVRPKVTDFHL